MYRTYTNPTYWNDKGDALLGFCEYEEAIKSYDKAIELDPNNPTYWINKGDVLRKLGRYEEALKCYDKAIELNPNEPVYWNDKGYTLRKLGRYEEALKCYDKAIELDPNNPTYWKKKGDALYELGEDEYGFCEYGEAIECYDKAIELNPNEPVYWINKGDALLELGEYEEAIKCYDKARELDPNDPTYRKKKGDVLRKLVWDIFEIIDEASEVVIDIIGGFKSETDALMWLKKLFITVGATNTKEYIEKVNQLYHGTVYLLLDFVNHVKEISKNLDGEELTYDEVKDIVYDLFAVKNTLEEIDPEDDEAAEEIMELIKKVEEAISEEYQKPE